MYVGRRNLTDLWSKANCLDLAGIAAYLADHLLLREAAVLNLNLQVPGWLDHLGQRIFATGLDAFTAKRAFTFAEIDLGVSRRTANDDLFRARANAVATRCALIGKRRLGDCSRRPEG